MGAWIEITFGKQIVQDLKPSLPVWERGLKFDIVIP